MIMLNKKRLYTNFYKVSQIFFYFFYINVYRSNFCNYIVLLIKHYEISTDYRAIKNKTISYDLIPVWCSQERSGDPPCDRSLRTRERSPSTIIRGIEEPPFAVSPRRRVAVAANNSGRESASPARKRQRQTHVRALFVDGRGEKRQEMSLLLRRLTLIRRDAAAALPMRISHPLVIVRVYIRHVDPSPRRFPGEAIRFTATLLFSSSLSSLLDLASANETKHPAALGSCKSSSQLPQECRRAQITLAIDAVTNRGLEEGEFNLFEHNEMYKRRET